MTNTTASQDRLGRLARASALVLAPVLAFTGACSSTDAPTESGATYSPSPQYSPDTDTTTSTDEPPHDLGVTDEAFQAITIGMTLEQVSAIIGSEPDDITYNELMDPSEQVGFWRDEYYREIYVFFTDTGALLLRIRGGAHPNIPPVDVTDLGITSQARQALYLGMSIEEVEAVIGSPASVTHVTGRDVPELRELYALLGTTRLYAWMGSDDPHIAPPWTRPSHWDWDRPVDPFISITFTNGLITDIITTI